MRTSVIAACLLSLALPACADREAASQSRDAAARSGDAAAGSREALSSHAAAALDRANADFRAGQYDAALAGYRVAAQRAPTHAAPYYGIFMVARATKDSALADSAMAAIRARTGGAGALSAGTFDAAHGGAADSGRGAKLPTGHPPVAPKPLPPGHPPTKGKATPPPATSPAPRGGA